MQPSLTLSRSTKASVAPTARLRGESLEERAQPSAVGFFALGAGFGGTPRVQVYEAASGRLIADFFAFEPTFNGGVNTAMADLNGDGLPELIVGAGVGGGPRVRVFNGAQLISQGVGFNPNANGAVIADFFAYEATQRGGAYVAAGQFGGTGANLDLVIGAGPGGGPRVRILNGSSIVTQGQTFTSERTGDTLANFFAFESTFRDGVTVAAGEVNVGTGFSDLATAPGPGGGPRVRLLKGTAIATQQTAYTSLGANDVIADFFAYPNTLRTGVFVALTDIDNDGFPDLVTGPGPRVGTEARINVFSGRVINTKGTTFTGSAAGDLLDTFVQAPFTGFANGATVGASLSANSGDLLLVGTGGQGAQSTAFVFSYQVGFGFASRNLKYSLAFAAPFLGGVNVSQ